MSLISVKSNKPFNPCHKHPDTPINGDSAMGFFPSMPECRGRGNYAIDKDTADDKCCNKDYKGHHRTLMPGIFTIFCQHGNSPLILQYVFIYFATS